MSWVTKENITYKCDISHITKDIIAKKNNSEDEDCDYDIEEDISETLANTLQQCDHIETCDYQLVNYYTDKDIIYLTFTGTMFEPPVLEQGLCLACHRYGGKMYDNIYKNNDYCHLHQDTTIDLTLSRREEHNKELAEWNSKKSNILFPEVINVIINVNVRDKNGDYLCDIDYNVKLIADERNVLLTSS